MDIRQSNATVTVDLGANNDVTIDGSSIVKAEDAGHATGDAGVMALSVRQDTAAALAGTDADYQPLITDASGRLHVLDANSAAIKTAVELIDNAISGTEMQVDVVAALPAGTNAIGKLAANTGVDIGDVDVTSVIPGTGATNLGKAIDTATGGTDTGVLPLATRDDALSALTPIEGDNVQLRVDANGALWTRDDVLEAALSGSELQVDVVAALPAGTNAIGKLAANSGVDIGDVDVTTMPGTAAESAALPSSFVVVAGDDGTDTHPLQLDGSGHLQVDIAADSVGIGGGTQYTEDDAGAANPVGTAPVFVRQDTPAGLVTADGDVVAARATNYGAQFVQVLDSSGNFINTFGGSGGTSHADDAAFSIGSASSITPAGFLADETTPDSVDEGDVGVARMTLSRKPYAVITDATNEYNAGVDSSGHLQVDIAASSATVTVDSELAAAAALSDAYANPTTAPVGSFLMGFDGTDWERVRVTNTGQLHVDVQNSSLTVAQSTASSLKSEPAGNVAHDAADSGNPIKFGGRAQDLIGANPEEVADNDRVDALFDTSGRLGVCAGHDYKYADINDATSGDNTIVAATVGKRIAVWSILMVSDGTADVRWEDGAAGTAFTGQVPLQAREGYSISAGGLVPLFVGTANTLLNLELSAAVNQHGFVSYTLEDD